MTYLWALRPLTSAGFGHWRWGRQGASEVRVFVLLPKGSPRTGSSLKGPVALSTHPCPSKFYTCFIPSPARLRASASAPLSEPWGPAQSLVLPVQGVSLCLVIHSQHSPQALNLSVSSISWPTWTQPPSPPAGNAASVGCAWTLGSDKTRADFRLCHHWLCDGVPHLACPSLSPFISNVRTPLPAYTVARTGTEHMQGCGSCLVPGR